MADGLNQANKIGEAFFEVAATGTEAAKKAVDSVRTSLDAAGVSGERMAQKTATGVSGFTQQIGFFNNGVADAISKIGLLTSGVQAVYAVASGAFNIGSGIGNYLSNDTGTRMFNEFADQRVTDTFARSAAQQTGRFSSEVYAAAGYGSNEALLQGQMARRESLEADKHRAEQELRNATMTSYDQMTVNVPDTFDRNQSDVSKFLFRTSKEVDADRKLKAIEDELGSYSQVPAVLQRLRDSQMTVYSQGYQTSQITSTFESFGGVSLGQAGQTELLRQIAQQGAFPSGPR